MEEIKRNATMWVDLLTSELRWKAERDAVTTRALVYLDAGMELEKVLDALKISRATWFRRVKALEETHAATRAQLDAQKAARDADEARRIAERAAELAAGPVFLPPSA